MMRLVGEQVDGLVALTKELPDGQGWCMLYNPRDVAVLMTANFVLEAAPGMLPKQAVYVSGGYDVWHGAVELLGTDLSAEGAAAYLTSHRREGTA